jgi:hypothetical protein
LLRGTGYGHTSRALCPAPGDFCAGLPEIPDVAGKAEEVEAIAYDAQNEEAWLQAQNEATKATSSIVLEPRKI